MKLAQLIDECFDKTYKAIEFAKDTEVYSNSTEVEVGTEHGIISIYVSARHGKKVQVFHDDNEHVSPNLERFIEDKMPDWSDVDEPGECCPLDPGFRDWNDYYAYKY